MVHSIPSLDPRGPLSGLSVSPLVSLENFWKFHDFEHFHFFGLQLLKFHPSFFSSTISSYYGSFNTKFLAALFGFPWTHKERFFEHFLAALPFAFQL